LKEDYKKIFDSLGKESEQEEETQSVVNDRVLIVDSLNMFLRSFTVIGSRKITRHPRLTQCNMIYTG
jgi:hypothetical protein